MIDAACVLEHPCCDRLPFAPGLPALLRSTAATPHPIAHIQGEMSYVVPGTPSVARVRRGTGRWQGGEDLVRELEVERNRADPRVAARAHEPITLAESRMSLKPAATASRSITTASSAYRRRRSSIVLG